jgi:hypothetical protein
LFKEILPPPIIRSANNCIYSIWHLSHLRLRKKHRKTSARVRKTSVRLRKTSEYTIPAHDDDDDDDNNNNISIYNQVFNFYVPNQQLGCLQREDKY